MARGENQEAWYEAQKGYLGQLKSLADVHNAPVACAGDIFDKWDSPARLINFALEHLPDRVYAVAGQHDLPNHDYGQIKRSAYWTLVEARKITNLTQGPQFQQCTPLGGSRVVLHGFPWGAEPGGLSHGEDGYLHVAVVHRYVWAIGHSHPGAKEEDHVSRVLDQFPGFRALVFGDNHSKFLTIMPRRQILNCGGFMRRRSDEEAYRPGVGLLYDDGHFEVVRLDTDGDQFSDRELLRSVGHMGLDPEEVLREMENLADVAVNFREAVLRLVAGNKVSAAVRGHVLRYLEGRQK